MQYYSFYKVKTWRDVSIPCVLSVLLGSPWHIQSLSVIIDPRYGQ